MRTIKNTDMSRRDLLAASAGGVLLAVAGGVAAAQKDHEHHHGAAKSPVVDAAEKCVSTGRACISHCLDSFKAGDTSLADCARSVENMMPVCDAMAQLATSGSRHRKALGQTCVAICEDCEKACRTHEDKHAVCKQCADACAALVKALKSA